MVRKSWLVSGDARSRLARGVMNFETNRGGSCHVAIKERDKQAAADNEIEGIQRTKNKKAWTLNTGGSSQTNTLSFREFFSPNAAETFAKS
jgi:hypothetical protein